MKKDKGSRCHHIILYDEDNSHIDALNYIIDSNYSYAYILHDNDFKDDTGELKKPHYHLILYFENARSIDSVCTELKIKNNYDVCDTKRNALEYLIHKNHKDKFQYNIDNVIGPLKNDLIKYLNNDVSYETDSVLMIFDYIDSVNMSIPFNSFIRWVCKNNFWSIYRRSCTTFIKYLDNHNQKWYIDDKEV